MAFEGYVIGPRVLCAEAPWVLILQDVVEAKELTPRMDMMSVRRFNPLIYHHGGWNRNRYIGT